MKKLALILLLFSMQLSAENSRQGIRIQPLPQWVQAVSVPTEQREIREGQVLYQNLLFDMQDHLPEKSKYRHFAFRVLDQKGVAPISKIQVLVNAQFQKIQFHSLQILRDGTWQDRASSAHYNVARREKGLQNGMIDGYETHILFVEDIRDGDIFEYSYSVVGANPQLPKKSAAFSTEINSPIETFFIQITGKEEALFWSTFRNAPAPEKSSLEDGLCRLTWNIENASPFAWEANIPNDCRCRDGIEVTEYRGWSEVVETLLPLYQVEEQPSLEMENLVKEWLAEREDPHQRALTALRFVQDEIHYIHLGEGIGAHKPRDPSKTLGSRIGDCKDKTLLLSKFLQLMGISSRPVLVNSSSGKVIPSSMPTHSIFNHVFLQLEVDGKTYYVDPVMSSQGGDLQTQFTPDYFFGLPISKNSSGLAALPVRGSVDPMIYKSTVTVVSDELAELEFCVESYGAEADFFRRSFQQAGEKEFKKKIEQYLRRIYPEIEAVGEIEYSDCRSSNRVLLAGGYKMPLRKNRKKLLLPVGSFVIQNHLQDNLAKDRKNSFALRFPTKVREEITVHNPKGNWTCESDSFSVSEDFFSCSYSEDIQGDCAKIQIDLTHKDNFVPEEKLRDYFEASQLIRQYEQIDLPI